MHWLCQLHCQPKQHYLTSICVYAGPIFVCLRAVTDALAMLPAADIVDCRVM